MRRGTGSGAIGQEPETPEKATTGIEPPRAKPGPPVGAPQRGGNEGTGHPRLYLRRWANGTTWWYADYHVRGERFVERLGLADSVYGLTRAEAEEELAERVLAATPLELYTERLDACLALLGTLSGVQTVRLSPSAFSVLAAQGWGEEIVMHAARMLVRAGLAEISWDVQGCERVPVVVPTAA